MFVPTRTEDYSIVLGKVCDTWYQWKQNSGKITKNSDIRRLSNSKKRVFERFSSFYVKKLGNMLLD
jgi:hypothetical protein